VTAVNVGLHERLQLVRWLDGDDAQALTDERVAALEPWIHQHVLAPLAYRRGLANYRGDYAATAIMAEMAGPRLDEVLEAMANAGVDAVPIKGVAYARDLYADPGERPMADIDLLVRPRERTSANDVMRTLGYVSAAESRFHHATMFQRGANEVFDIHASIVSPWRSRIDLDAVWRRTRRVGEQLRLDPVDETLFHFVGMARNAMLDTLIHYVDAARLLRRLDDSGRRALGARAREYHVLRAVAAGLHLTNEIIPTDSRGAAPPWLPPTWLEDIVNITDLAGMTLVKRKLLLADGTRERAGHIVQWLLEQPARWSNRLNFG